jgi:hypothetical protein
MATLGQARPLALSAVSTLALFALLMGGCGARASLGSGESSSGGTDAGVGASPTGGGGGGAGAPPILGCDDPVTGCTEYGQTWCLKAADCAGPPASWQACELHRRDMCLRFLAIDGVRSSAACEMTECLDLGGPGCLELSLCLSHDLRGELADGADCPNGAACQSGLCKPDGTSPCGACGPKHALGEACYLSFECAEGLSCRPNAVPGGPKRTCQPAPALGDPCDPGEECAPLWTCALGICAVPPSYGGACDGLGSNQCGLGECVDGTCTGGAPGPGLGEPCVDHCQLGAVCWQGLCHEAALPGEPCLVDAPDPSLKCLAPYDYECTNGVCAMTPFVNKCVEP